MGFRELTFAPESVFLVTGGAGFIGSNLCEAILDMGYTVRCLDNLSTGHYENIEPFLANPRFTFLKEDIRDLDSCLHATEGVDFVLNEAAWGSVPRSIEMPLLYEEINIRGTLNMMEAARQNGVKKFDFPPCPVDYGYRDSKYFWYHQHRWMIPELLPVRKTTLSSVRYAADRIDPTVHFTDDALEMIVNVPRVFLPTVLRGCVAWAKENGVTEIGAAEMRTINDKRSKEKKG